MKKFISLFVLLSLLLWNIWFTHANNECKIIESNKYDSAFSPTYSPDGKSFTFVAIKDGKSIIVKDWVEINKYDGIRFSIYSPDGKSFFYIAESDWKWFIVKDWVESDKYNKVASLKYSPDGKSFAFVAIKDGNGK